MKELLELGQQGFRRQLQTFLAERPGLLWMSQVQAGDMQAAADSLARAAATCRGSLLQANRVLCLTKLAARAAAGLQGGGSSEALKAKATARLQQLQLQSDLLPGRDAAPAMTTQQLAQVAIQAAGSQVAEEAAAAGGGLVGGDAAVAAVEALALDPEQYGTDSFK